MNFSITFVIKGNRKLDLYFFSFSLFSFSKGFISAILPCDGNISTFVGRLITLARWIAITAALPLKNLAEICSILEALATSKFFKIFSTDATFTLCKAKSSHLLWICLQYSSVVLIPNLFFGHGSFSSSESAKFEKNRQKIFAFFLGWKETTSYYFNDILLTTWKIWNSPEFIGIAFIFLVVKNFYC